MEALDGKVEALAGLVAFPGSTPTLGRDELAVERSAGAIGAIRLAGVERTVVAERRRVLALARLRGIRFVFQLHGRRIRLLDHVPRLGAFAEQRARKRRDDQAGCGELDEPAASRVSRGFGHE